MMTIARRKRSVTLFAYVVLLAGCGKLNPLPSVPRIAAPANVQMEQLAVYSAFLARQVPQRKHEYLSGRRLQGLMVRNALSRSGVQKFSDYVFSNGRLIYHAGLGGRDRSHELQEGVLENFSREVARGGVLFERDAFTGPFDVVSKDELEAHFHLENCRRPERCGLRLIDETYPNSGGVWAFSHIGFSSDHQQALVCYSEWFRGESGIALLTRRDGAWQVTEMVPLEVS